MEMIHMDNKTKGMEDQIMEIQVMEMIHMDNKTKGMEDQIMEIQAMEIQAMEIQAMETVTNQTDHNSKRKYSQMRIFQRQVLSLPMLDHSATTLLKMILQIFSRDAKLKTFPSQCTWKSQETKVLLS